MFSGNIWGQSWTNIIDVTIPYPGKVYLDVTQEMQAQVTGKNYIIIIMRTDSLMNSTGLGHCFRVESKVTCYKVVIRKQPRDGTIREMLKRFRSPVSLYCSL